MTSFESIMQPKCMDIPPCRGNMKLTDVEGNIAQKWEHYRSIVLKVLCLKFALQGCSLLHPCSNFGGKNSCRG